MTSIEHQASTVSKLSFAWVAGLFATRPEDLELESMFALPKGYRAAEADGILSPFAKGDSIAKRLIGRFAWPILGQGALMVVATLAGIGSSLVLQELVNLMIAGQPPVLLQIVGLALLLITHALAEQHSLQICLKLCVPLRSAILFGIVHKLLAIPVSVAERLSGTIHNLVHKDSMLVGGVIADTAILVITPVRIVALVAALYFLLGTSALIGVAFLALTIFATRQLSKRLARAAKAKAEAGDVRLRATATALTEIEQIKLDGHVAAAYQEISRHREAELSHIAKFTQTNALLSIVAITSAVLVAVVTFVAYIGLEGSLTTGTALAAINLFALLRPQLMAVPALLSRFYEAQVAARRIDSFLEEQDRQHSPAPSTPNETSIATIGDIEIKPGELVAIIGHPGSGKTTLLNELRTSSSLGWVDQHAWLFSGSVRQNIICDQPYDDQRLDDVITRCQLRQDIAEWQNGLDHQVGELGANVSGGQRMRIAFARALYKQPAVIVLDDPFAPLDPIVADGIMVDGILPAKSARIVVINDEKWLGYCDRVWQVVDHNLIERKDHVPDRSESKSKAQASKLTEASQEPTTQPNPEKRQTGAISATTIRALLAKAGGPWPMAALVGLVFGAEVVKAALDALVSQWSSAQLPSIDDVEFVQLYGGLALASVSAIGSAWLLSAKLSVALGRVSHDAALTRLLHASQRFHDSQPTGQMLNRLNSDVNELDSRLIPRLAYFLLIVFGIIVTFGIALATQPMILPVLLAVLVAYFRLQRRYRAYSREIKRLNAAARSPLYQLLGDVIKGVPIITRTSTAGFFKSLLLSQFNREQESFYTLMAVNRWIAVRLELLATFIVMGLLLLSYILPQTAAPSLLALAITYAIMAATQFNLGVRWLSVVEQCFTSVERLLPYWQLPKPSRADPEPFVTPATLRLSDVTFAYGSVGKTADDQEPALTGVGLEIAPGAKIGICGRTGCGKSTLLNIIAGLYALEPSEGSFQVGDAQVTPQTVAGWRSQVTAVRQGARYRFGSVLVALGTTDEAKAKRALTDVGLWPSFTNQNLALSDPITDWSLSPGESQLFGIAKALLATEWCLAFDEPTSSLDDSARQRFYQQLKGIGPDKTLVVVSHDIGTLLCLDEVIVMASGTIAERGAPQDLLKAKGSAFAELFGSSG